MLPRFNFASLHEKEDGIEKFYESILEQGFALVENLPTVPGTVTEFVEKIFGLPVQKTIYGEVLNFCTIRGVGC